MGSPDYINPWPYAIKIHRSMEVNTFCRIKARIQELEEGGDYEKAKAPHFLFQCADGEWRYEKCFGPIPYGAVVSSKLVLEELTQELNNGNFVP